MAANYITVKSSLDLRGFLLGNYFPGDKLSLSDRLYSPSMVNAIAEDLRVSMSGTLKFRDLVKDLSNYTTAEDLKQPIREIISAARSMMAGDVSGISDFKKMVSAYPDLADDPSKLDKAYAKIVSAAEQLNSDALDAAVDNALDKKALANAFRLAVTETNRAYNIGAFTEAKNDEDCVAGQFDVSTSVENCEVCLELSERDNGAGPGIYPLDNFPAIPIHPHCVLPGNRVWFEGKLVGATKSFYCGLVKEICLISGKKLSLTVNHPVLTSNGWVAADKLTKGDKVVSCRSGERPFFGKIFGVTSAQPDNNKRPPRIKNIFRTVKKSFHVAAASVPVAVEDFHGDGRFVNGNIDIVNTNGLLLNDIQAAISKHASKFIFSGRNIAESSLKCFGMVKFVFKRPVILKTFGMIRFLFDCFFSAANSIVCGLCNFLSPLWRVVKFNKKTKRIPKPAPFNASFFKPIAYNISCHAKIICNFLFRFASNIFPNNFVGIKKNSFGYEPPGFFECAPLDIGFYKPALDNISTNPVAVREALLRLSGDIAFDEIVNIRTRYCRTHVYDLQVEPSEIYISNGVIVKNCMCLFTPVYKLPGGMSGDDLETSNDFENMKAME